MRTILITGGAGYIGSTLVSLLLDNNYKVVVIDNFLYNQTSLLNHIHNSNFSLVYGDVRDPGTIVPLIKEADIIIPLAALVGAPVCDLNKHGAVSVNYEAIELINKFRTPSQTVIFPMTNSGYGIGQKGLFCTEETPLNPISLYGKTKASAEKLLLNTGNAVSLRLATVFGFSPRMRLDLLVNDFTYRACTDKFIVVFDAHAKRNYIHVKDVAKAFLHVITNIDTMNNNIYNVGLSTANLSKYELALKIKEQIADFYIHLNDYDKDPDQRDYIVSNDKIEKTGYLPDYSLENGITEMIKGYKILKNNKFNNL